MAVEEIKTGKRAYETALSSLNNGCSGWSPELSHALGNWLIVEAIDGHADQILKFALEIEKTNQRLEKQTLEAE